MAAVKALLYLLVYPGALFLFVYATVVEWVDRKLYARFQNRVGPLYTGRSGILQPVADLIKLLAKEDITPAHADKPLFNFAPFLALASVFAAGLLLPVWHFRVAAVSATSFPGDIIVLAYLLSLPSFAFFLAGWSARGMYSALGATRVMTLLFAYEVPLFLAALSPAVLAGSWKLGFIASWYHAHPWAVIATLPGCAVALIALQAKLERVPFDIPEAETELVGGAFTEYSGRKYAMFRLAIAIQMVVGAGFVAALFLGGFPGGLVPGFLWFVGKTLAVCVVLAAMRTVLARLRIDQMVDFAWRYLAPLALLQLAAAILVRGFLR